MKRTSKPLHRLLAACLALAIAPAAIAATAPAAYSPPLKPAKTTLGRYDSREFIEVKFAQGSSVGLVNGRLSSATHGRGSVLDALTAGAGPVATVEPLFRASPATLASTTKDAQQRSGRALADLSQWYRLRLRPGQDPARVIDQLNAMALVEIAYAAPLPAPSPTPNFNAYQQYRGPIASNGVDTDYGWNYSGGGGANIRVLDIEYSWNTDHEDLSKLRQPGARIANGTPVDPFNNTDHGTAVMGILSADNNGFGVTGLVPDAIAQYTNAYNIERGYDPANAVFTAAYALLPGDVMVLEQQAFGPPGCSGYVPVEWIPSVYDAIALATSRGIHVIQAAGNGNMNLDNAACFGSPFPNGRPDSGAIIVGAGGPSAAACSSGVPERAKLSFSSYGARVNLQGWGACVTTTGYGSLYSGGVNSYYTGSFDGTSSATPIVASTVVALSGILKIRGFIATPQQMRDALIATGTGQTGGGHIGPLPNLRTALNSLGL